MGARGWERAPSPPDGLVFCPLFVTWANTGIYRPTGMSWFSCGESGKACFAVLALS